MAEPRTQPQSRTTCLTFEVQYYPSGMFPDGKLTGIMVIVRQLIYKAKSLGETTSREITRWTDPNGSTEPSRMKDMIAK